MSEDADVLRTQARECRELSRLARDQHDRIQLAQLAGELEEEAAKMDAEDAARDASKH